MSKDHRQIIPTLSRDQQAVFDACISGGLLGAYEAAMRKVNPDRFPKCIQTSMMQFVAYMAPFRNPKRELIFKYRTEFGRRVDFYANHGILLIVDYDTQMPLGFVVNPANKRRDPRIERVPLQRSPSSRLFDSAMNTQDPRRFRGSRDRRDFHIK